MTLHCPQIEYVRFTAGTRGDPKPAENEQIRRYARCVKCNKIIHFSPTAGRWVDDGGHFHTGHEIEFPERWLPR